MKRTRYITLQQSGRPVRHRNSNILSLLAVLWTSALLLTGCGDGSTDPMGGGNNGGGGNEIGTEPTFSNIQLIFNESCALSGCHNSSSAQAGVDLSSYSAVMNSRSSAQTYDKDIVIPNDPNGSPLVDKIEDNPNFGSRMPKGGNPLPQSRIDQIRDWISNGAQNN